MVLLKVLKRKDASSVVVAVAVGLALLQFVTAVTAHLASWISGTNQFAPNGQGFKSEYLYPAVSFVLILLALEVLGWIYVWANSMMKQK